MQAGVEHEWSTWLARAARCDHDPSHRRILFAGRNPASAMPNVPCEDSVDRSLVVTPKDMASSPHAATQT